eukprot:COSAG05_NODE_2751_length_2684_cov_12.033058_1_plen_460_part_00
MTAELLDGDSKSTHLEAHSAAGAAALPSMAAHSSCNHRCRLSSACFNQQYDAVDDLSGRRRAGLVVALVCVVAASFVLWFNNRRSHGAGGTGPPLPSAEMADFVVVGDGIQRFQTSAAGAYVPLSSPLQFNATGVSASWAEALPDGRLALTTSRNSVILWDPRADTLVDAVELSLGELSTPVGTTIYDGLLYVACFGDWITPPDTREELPGSGLAVINLNTLDVKTYRYCLDGCHSHVHNVYAFHDGLGAIQIYAAVLGNPWHQNPVTGAGLVKFDRATTSFISYTMAINVRSATQQSDGSIYVLTQEPMPGYPSPQPTKLGRVGHQPSNGAQVAGALFVENVTTLPKFEGSGDGGADVLSLGHNSILATDRTGAVDGGRLYHYQFDEGAGFTLLRSLDTGHHPRFTTVLENGDVVSCNLHGGTINIFAGLALNPDDESIQGRKISAGIDSPWFFAHVE